MLNVWGMDESTTVRIDGREMTLVPRADGQEPQPGWARALIDDPTQQHIVHLLAWRWLAYEPGRDHHETMAELEIELAIRFVPVAVETESLAQVA